MRSKTTSRSKFSAANTRGPKINFNMQTFLRIRMTICNLSMCDVFNEAVCLWKVVMEKSERNGSKEHCTLNVLCHCAVNLKSCFDWDEMAELTFCGL